METSESVKPPEASGKSLKKRNIALAITGLGIIGTFAPPVALAAGVMTIASLGAVIHYEIQSRKTQE